MRSLLLSLTLLAALGLAALTPGEASAFGWRNRAYYDGYTSGYYVPTYSYYGAYPYYTTSSYGGYGYSPYLSTYVTPYVTSTYAPVYGAYSSSYYAPPYAAYQAATSYYYTPGYSSFYYSPSYNRSYTSWAPFNRLYP